MKATLLVVALFSTLAMFPVMVQSEASYGPNMDYLHIINYGDPDTEFAALDAGSIDITDWPLTPYWINKWVGEGRIPSEITLGPYAAMDAFEYDIYDQKWPTGCDGVAAREGYAGTFTRGAYTWNQFHTRQRPETSPGMHPPTYSPGTQTTPMGDGADYDPETESWKTYFDEDCLWCTMAWGLRLAIAYATDKDYIVSTILEGLGQEMITKAAAPAHSGYVDVENLTASSFVYHGPEADVTIPSLVFGHGMTRAQMDAKVDELLDAAGFKDWDGDGTRNDPRKVAGPDKHYGTGDDVKTSASNMNDLIFYIRLDDPMREAAGLKLSADLEAHDVPVDARDAEKTVCFSKVKLEYNYHLYTAGWVLSPDPDYLYHLFHSSMYLYPLGWSSNYPGFCHTLADAHLDDVKSSSDYDKIIAGFHNATFLINKYVASIPLWSSASAKAYRTGWEGTVNMAGEGKDNYWSFFMMSKAGEDTINWGFKSSPEDLNVITAEWLWDRKVLGLTYESLIIRNPYNVAEKRGMLATSWSTGTWDTDKVYVDFTLKCGVKWHDGTLLTAEDVKWALEFVRDCGPGVAWTYPVEDGGTYLETSNLEDLDHVEVLIPGAGGSVRVYFKTGSYWAVHWAGFQLLPSRKIWMNASAHYGWGYDPAKPPGVGPGKRWPDDNHRMMVRDYHPYEHDIYDPSSATPQADGIVDQRQDGTGPWIFIDYTGSMGNVEYIDLDAWRQHHLSQSEVSWYLSYAFHKLGNVNYAGSVHEAEYIAAGYGIDHFINAADEILVSKAMNTTPADPPGIDWGEWNVDCDFNNDNVINGMDLAIVGANYGRSGNGGFPPATAPIKIGVIGPMVWMQGQGMKEGACIARDEINAGGGILGRNVELVFADTLRGQQHPDNVTGTAAAMELVAAGCDFMIGGYWNEAVFAAREVFMDNKKIFLITGATDDQLIDDVRENYARYKYLFRVAPVNSTTIAKALWAFHRFVLESKLRHLFGGEGVPDEQVRVAVVSENLTLWDEMHENMTNPAVYPYILGPYANVTFSTRVSLNATDFSAVLQGVNASGARLIIHLFSTQAGVNFIVQWRNMGVKALPVGINVLSQQSEMWELTAGKCEDETILATSGTRTPISPKALMFYDETLSRYGHAPICTSYGTYDAIYTLKEAIEAAGTTDADTLIPKLEQTDRISTRGRFKFTEYHDVFCNEIGANWVYGYARPLFVQWQKSPITGEARLEVVYPMYDRAAAFARKWKIPKWIYSLAETDINLDRKVDVTDIVISAAAYGTKAGDPRWDIRCDTDGNGIINIADLSRLANDYGKVASSLSLSVVGASGGTASTTTETTQTNSKTTVYLDPPTINGTIIGETFTVNININDAVDIYSWQAGMAFNATLLECTGVFMGEFLQSVGSVQWLLGEINNTSGEITPYACSFLGNYSASGDGRLAYATFKVKAPGLSDIHLRDVMVMDYWGVENYEMVPFNTIDVYTVVRSPAQTVFIISNSTGVEPDGYNFPDGEPVLITIGSGFYGHAFSHPDEKLHFNVTGPYPGFSNVTIPKTLIEVDILDQLLVIIDDIPLKTEERTVTDNATHYFIHFNYNETAHSIRILKRPPVYNINKNRYYATIQEAIDAPETLDGHTILAFAGTRYEHVVVNKSVALIGESKHNTTIDGSGTGTVIKVTADNVKISNFTIQNSGNPEYGILVDDSSNNIITNNIITNNFIGICVRNSSGNTLTNNNMFGNKYNFELCGTEGSHFNNTIDVSNTVDGKPVYYVKKASNAVYNSLTNAGTFYLIDCTNVTVRDLTLTKNVNGIFLWNTTNSKIQNVNASHNLKGIYLQGYSNHNNLADNIVSNNELGIYSYSSNNSAIYHNSFIENTIQAKVIECYNTVWDNGYPSGGNYWSDYRGIDLYRGPCQNETGNDGIWDHEYVIDANNVDNYPLISPLTPPVFNIDTYLGYTKIQDAMDASQTSHGHTIIVRAGTYYEHVTIDKSLTLVGITGSTVIDGGGTGTVVTITVNDVTLRGFTIQGSGSTDQGILMSNANNTFIIENTINNNGYGIRLDHSDSCTICGNTINNNLNGIHLEYSLSAVISGNTLTNNSNGIVLSYSSGNAIHRNNVTHNKDVGIRLFSSSGNTIYYNNFINNTRQIDLFQSSSTWDDGGLHPCPICSNPQPRGNHWSDYAGLDDGTPTQAHNCPADGIGDTGTPHLGVDNYPLMSPWLPVAHDVAVVSVTPSKTVVCQSYIMFINVTVENQGDYIEAFNVAAYVNSTIIATLTNIVLTSESSMTITFAWNTTGFAKGNYTVSVNATVALGETDTGDNSYTYGTVRVVMVGDMNGNGKVTITDIVIIALAFGTKPGDQHWNPNADINNDGRISITDIVIAALHFGETDP